MPRSRQAPHQRGDAGAFGVAVELVAEHVAVILEPDVPLGELGRNRRRAARSSMMSRVFLPILAISDCLLVDRDQLAAADHADAVGHLLGFLDIMGGEDDRRPVGAELADQLPHVAAKLDVDAGGRLVEEQDRRARG